MKAVLTLVANKLQKILSSVEGVNLYSLQFVIHYLKGNRETMTLPEKYMAESKEAVITSINRHFRKGSNRKGTSLTAELGDGDWFSNASGVVGRFNFRIAQFSTEGVHIKCYDTWDFNPAVQDIFVPEQFKGYVPLIKRVCHLLRIKYQKYEDCYGNETISIEEKGLQKFNSSHSFNTEWEHFLTWEEFLPTTLGKNKRQREPRYSKEYLLQNIRFYDNGNYMYLVEDKKYTPSEEYE